MSKTAYFVKNTDKGVVVSSAPLVKKTVKINGKDRVLSTQTDGLVFGFFACENPEELALVAGQKIDAVQISNKPVVIEGTPSTSLFWCTPA